MLKRMRFRFRPEGYWLIDISRDYPSVTFLMSLIYIVEDTVHTDVVVHTENPDVVDEIERRCREHPQVRDMRRVYDGPRGTRFHASYETSYSFYPHIVDHTPVALGTVRLRDGTEHYEIIGEPEDLQGILDRMATEGDLEVEMIEELAPAYHDRDDELPLGVELTAKQIEALTWAHADGYFQWPRQRSASDIASKVDISLSAFLDRLRQAEARILERFVQAFREQAPGQYNEARKELRERGGD